MSNLSHLSKSLINCFRPRTFFCSLYNSAIFHQNIFFTFLCQIHFERYFNDFSKCRSALEICTKKSFFFIRDHKRIETCTIRNLNNTESCLLKAEKKTNNLTNIHSSVVSFYLNCFNYRHRG